MIIDTTNISDDLLRAFVREMIRGDEETQNTIQAYINTAYAQGVHEAEFMCSSFKNCPYKTELWKGFWQLGYLSITEDYYRMKHMNRKWEKEMKGYGNDD